MNNGAAIIPKDEGSETRGGINDRTPENNEGRVGRATRRGAPVIQATGINNLLGPGMILPDYGSLASNYFHVYQDPRRNIFEYPVRPWPIWPRDPATISPFWAPIVERMGMRFKYEMGEEEKGLVLSLAPPNASEKLSLTLTLGRDSFVKGKQVMEINPSKNDATSSIMLSMELREYGKYLSLRPPGTEDRLAFQLLGNRPGFPRVGWTGEVFHSGGADIPTDFAQVNPDTEYKCMPFSFDCDEDGHLVPTGQCNPSFGQFYWKGADNIVYAGYPFANHGPGLQLLRASNNVRGTRVHPGFVSQPIYQAYGRGSGGLYPTTYSAPVGTGQNIPVLPTPVYKKGKGVTTSAKPGIAYKIVEDNAAASSSTGKKDHISKGKLVLISEDTAEFCDESDAVLVPQKGNQEPVDQAPMQQPVHKGKGLLIRRGPLQTHRKEMIPTGIKEGAHSDNSSSTLPDEHLDTAGSMRKRKYEGAKRPKGRAQPTPFPADVRSLLSTGVLDGVPVKYATWTREKVLRGVIAQDKILCGCQDCNYTTPINPLEFERHAGGNTKHPNNHIHFPNGKTIYEIVQGLQKIETENLFQAMKNMAGHPLNQLKFEAWKATYQASGIEARRALGAAESSNAQGSPMKTANSGA